MMTNTGKTKAEVILELLLSLNRSGSGYINERVRYACDQYNTLVERGIIEEEEEQL